MVSTRSKTRSMRSKKQIYRSRVRHSPCRGQTSTGCREKYGCKTAKGRKRTFCRKTRNRRT